MQGRIGVGVAVAILVFQTTLGLGASAPPAQGQQRCLFHRLIHVVDTTGVIGNHPNRAIKTPEKEPLRSREHGLALAKQFSQSFRLPQNDMNGNVAELRRKAQEIASDTTDPLFVASQPYGGSLKMHLSTGEMLLTDHQGNVAALLQLPLGERAVGQFRSTVDIFNFLNEKFPMGDPKRSFQLEQRLGVGRDLRVSGFTSPASLENHFQKHVRENKEFSSKNSKDYEAAAVKLANSVSGNVISITRQALNPEGLPVMETWKFDPTTNEIVVVDRDRARVITYYRYNPTDSNKALARMNIPPTGNIFEYVLVLSQLR